MIKDDIVNEYNNTYHRTIKMKSIDFKNNTYINSNEEVHDKDPKFKVGDHVWISKYKNSFAKGYTPNWSEEVFVIRKVKNTVPWILTINVYELILHNSNSNYSTLESFLFGGAKLTRSTEIDNYKYFGYGIYKYMTSILKNAYIDDIVNLW